MSRPVSFLIDIIILGSDSRCTELPDGSIVEAIVPHGASYWTRTAEITTQLSEGTPASYFLKVSESDNTRNMTVGEYESMLIRPRHKTTSG